LGIVNRGSPKIIINELARELFLFCIRHHATTSVEWVPREENVFADEFSKLLIPEDSMLSKRFFGPLDGRRAHILCNSSHPAQTTIARSYMHYIGAKELRESVPPDNFGRGIIVRSNELTT